MGTLTTAMGRTRLGSGAQVHFAAGPSNAQWRASYPWAPSPAHDGLQPAIQRPGLDRLPPPPACDRVCGQRGPWWDQRGLPHGRRGFPWKLGVSTRLEADFDLSRIQNKPPTLPR